MIRIQNHRISALVHLLFPYGIFNVWCVTQMMQFICVMQMEFVHPAVNRAKFSRFAALSSLFWWCVVYLMHLYEWEWERACARARMHIQIWKLLLHRKLWSFSIELIAWRLLSFLRLVFLLSCYVVLPSMRHLQLHFHNYYWLFVYYSMRALFRQCVRANVSEPKF